jgi:YfiH family protein
MFNETKFGFELITSSHIVFFGKKNCTLDTLQHLYPHFLFTETKQTHSDILIESTTGSIDIIADAQWTTKKNVALIVKTADCIPAMIYDQGKNLVLSVHAGWRGVENKITKKAIDHLNLSTDIHVYIGPHIQKNSFACDLDVKNLLTTNNSDYEFKDGKYFIDLKAVLLSQIKCQNTFCLDIDTLTNLNFNSYRRDKENSNRNLSFIAKI